MSAPLLLVKVANLLVLFVEVGKIPRVLSYHESLCVGMIKSLRRNSLGSAAARVFGTDVNGLSSQLSKGPEDVIGYPTHQLSIFPIKYDSDDIVGEGNVLFGWFHVRITYESGSEARSKKMSLLILQGFINVKDKRSPEDAINHIPGNFVTTLFENDCKESFGAAEEGFVHKDYREAISPCYFAPTLSTQVPNTILYTDNGVEGKKIGDSQYNFRMDFPECTEMNQENPFLFRIYTSHRPDTTTGPVPLNKVNQMQLFISNNAYGGFDPEPPRRAHVSCDSSGEGFSDAPWIDRAEVSTAPPDVAGTICFKNAEKSDQRFQGRCGSGNATQPPQISPKETYKCVKRPPHREELPDVEDVLVPPDKCISCEKSKNNTRNYGITASSSIGLYVWGFRSVHGIMMSIGTMFLVPVGTLSARYFKESHMGYRLVGLHVWYAAHITSSVNGFSVLLSGMVVGTVARAFFGYSWHPVAINHVVFGWISIVIYLISLGVAPFRVYKMSGRVASIFIHSFLGWASRILWTICLLTSFYIPGSPAARKDINKELVLEYDMLIVLFWLVVDIGVHVFLQLQMWKIEVTYPRIYAWFLVPIPRLRPSDERDAPETITRNYAFAAYSGISFLCAALLSVLICTRHPSDRVFGKMTQTHGPSGNLNYLFVD